jgi:hypothetical protein
VDVDCTAAFNKYLSGRDRGARYASFDYCFNYFQSFRERGGTEQLAMPENLESSCLHLGFYLASWGMFRGSSDLSENSLWGLVPVVQCIAAEPESVWTYDVSTYPGNMEAIRRLGARIGGALPATATDTLVTKTLLGVFGCVPAVDRYFKTGFECTTFGPKLLDRLHTFYVKNSEELDSLRVPTLDFGTGSETGFHYPIAKVLDMIFFQVGKDASE